MTKEKKKKKTSKGILSVQFSDLHLIRQNNPANLPYVYFVLKQFQSKNLPIASRGLFPDIFPFLGGSMLRSQAQSKPRCGTRTAGQVINQACQKRTDNKWQFTAIQRGKKKKKKTHQMQENNSFTLHLFSLQERNLGCGWKELIMTILWI